MSPDTPDTPQTEDPRLTFIRAWWALDEDDKEDVADYIVSEMMPSSWHAIRGIENWARGIEQRLERKKEQA